MRPRDTDEASHRAQIRLHANATPQARVELAAQLSDDVRAVAVAGIRARHPFYSEEEVRLAALRLFLGDELYRRAYPKSARLAP